MNSYTKIIISQIMLGSVAAFARWAHLPSEVIVLFRAGVGALALSLFALRKDEIMPYLKLNKKFLLLCLTGAFMATNWYFFFQAVTTTEIASTILLYNFAPLFVMLSAVLFLKEYPTVRQVSALIAALFGVFLVLNANGAAGGADALRGGVFALIAGALYAQVTILGRYLRDVPAIVVTFFQTAVGALVFLPVAAPQALSHHISLNQIAILVGMGVFHTAVPYYLYFSSLKTIKASVAGIFQYLYTLSTILFGLFAFSEHLSASIVIGGSVILLSSYVSLKFPGTMKFRDLLAPKRTASTEAT